MILDSKTIQIPTNAADGGFYDIKGKLRTRMGTGDGKALVGGVAYLNGFGKGTTAVTTEETLMSYTLPADSLSSDGKGLRIIAWGTTAYNTNKKTIRIKFGETVIMTNRVVTAPANLDWRLEAIIIGRMISIKGIGSGTLGSTTEAVLFTTEYCNLAAPVEIKLTGQNGTPSADDIYAQGLIVETLN